ncbi:hypothetical protein EIP86_002979 [Pleurotus ostreatoroseus]|nr:hypothetical protein EIP86_002979 [Pleurotus ostreatoroseus]
MQQHQQQNQRRRQFLNGLASIMLQRGTPLPPSTTGMPYPPGYDPTTSPWRMMEFSNMEPGVVRLAGKDIDLFKLWAVVQQSGSGQKLNQINGWSHVLSHFDLPEYFIQPNGTQQPTAAQLQNYYSMLLSPFEEVYRKNMAQNIARERAMAAARNQAAQMPGTPSRPGSMSGMSGTFPPVGTLPAVTGHSGLDMMGQPVGGGPAQSTDTSFGGLNASSFSGSQVPGMPQHPMANNMNNLQGVPDLAALNGIAASTSQASDINGAVPEQEADGRKRKLEEVEEGKRAKHKSGDSSDMRGSLPPSGIINSMPNAPARTLRQPSRRKIEYVPLAREVDTAGGRDLEVINQEFNPSRGQLRDLHDWGTVDVEALTLSLRSRISTELSYALTTFTVISLIRFKDSGFQITQAPDLFEELLDLLEEVAFEGPEEEHFGDDTDAVIVTHRHLINLITEEGSDPFASLKPQQGRKEIKNGLKQRPGDVILCSTNIIRNLAMWAENMDLMARHPRLLSILLRLCSVKSPTELSSPIPLSHVMSLSDLVQVRKDTIAILLNIAANIRLGARSLPSPSLLRDARRAFNLMASFIADLNDSVPPFQCIQRNGPPSQPGALRPPSSVENTLEVFTRLTQPDENRLVFAKAVPQASLWLTMEALVHRLPVAETDFTVVVRQDWLAYIERTMLALYSLTFIAPPKLKKRVKADRELALTNIMLRIIRRLTIGTAPDQRQTWSVVVRRAIETLKLVDDAGDSFNTSPTTGPILSFGMGYGEHGESRVEKGMGLLSGHQEEVTWGVMMQRDVCTDDVIRLNMFYRHAARRLPLTTFRRWSHATSTLQLGGVTAEDVAHFAKILPTTSILSTFPPSSTPASELTIYNDDWMKKYHGKATTVLKPHTAQEVSEIVKWCNERRIGIVPQGGNTGLVGGGVPTSNELIINLGNMTKIRSFDPVSVLVPVFSCQIGGNVSTNAGGLRLLRYGSLHGSVLGLEVVLPDGTILDQLSTLRKDNTGYDLKQLFIGAEGTLGIVTGVSILAAPAPIASSNVMLALPKFENVLPLYRETKRQLSEILSAFEFIDRRAYDLAVKHGQGRALNDEDIEGAECFVLVETSGGKREHDEEKLNSLLESLLDSDSPLINTGVLSQNPAQFSSLWAIREGITEAVSKEGKAYKYDISIPLASFKEAVDKTREHLRSKGLLRDDAVKHVVGYGHVGDGNLHLNVVAAEYTQEITDALEPFVYELVVYYDHLCDGYFAYNDDENGMAIKFFIQKDIPKEMQAEVCENIAALGGRVEAKVPRAGYVLVQPGTAEEERLRTCWSSADRPERHFVPYTFVEACKIAGMLLKQIFVEEGQPIRMHIDSSIANVNVRVMLAQRITHSGGDPTASAQNAKVILADPNTEVFQHLVKTYQSEAKKYVESYLWVKKCIEKGTVMYTPVVYKNPGGRRAGEERTHFTEDDEEHLCQWIAAKIPYKETGGRTGNRLYQQLCDMARHKDVASCILLTYYSWRERYKKNAARLDVRITEIVARVRPVLGEKGQYGYVRKPEEKPKRTKKKRQDTEESAGQSNNDELDFLAPPVPEAKGIEGDLLPPGQFGGFQSSDVPMVQSEASIPAEVEAARLNATEEEDDDPDWQPGIGDGPQPNWAKRKAEEEEEGSRKRHQSGSVLDRLRPRRRNLRSNARRSSDEQEADTPNLHVVDQAVLDIAVEFRFTPAEVKEYYDQCGDVERTKNRFKKMRELLSTLPDDADAAKLSELS